MTNQDKAGKVPVFLLEEIDCPIQHFVEDSGLAATVGKKDFLPQHSLYVHSSICSNISRDEETANYYRVERKR